MGLTRIELSGTVVKPPAVGVTPGGRMVLRLTVDCGQEPERLLLDVVLADDAAADLARMLAVGCQVRAAGALRGAIREPLGGAARQRIEVIANEIALEQPAGKPGARAPLLNKLG